MVGSVEEGNFCVTNTRFFYNNVPFFIKSLLPASKARPCILCMSKYD